MYDHIFNKQVQISRSDIRPHIKWAVSLVILHMVTSISLQGLCGYIWVNILTLSPHRAFSAFYLQNCSTSVTLQNVVQNSFRKQNSMPSSLQYCILTENLSLIAALSFSLSLWRSAGCLLSLSNRKDRTRLQLKPTDVNSHCTHVVTILTGVCGINTPCALRQVLCYSILFK